MRIDQIYAPFCSEQLVSGVRFRVSGKADTIAYPYETLYEIPPGPNSEQIERPTSNLEY
jgi:hypothetical protein